MSCKTIMLLHYQRRQSINYFVFCIGSFGSPKQRKSSSPPKCLMLLLCSLVWDKGSITKTYDVMVLRQCLKTLHDCWQRTGTWQKSSFPYLLVFGIFKFKNKRHSSLKSVSMSLYCLKTFTSCVHTSKLACAFTKVITTTEVTKNLSPAPSLNLEQFNPCLLQQCCQGKQNLSTMGNFQFSNFKSGLKKEKKRMAGGMPQLAQCFPYKNEDMSSDLQHLGKNRKCQVQQCISNPNTGETEA